ncbi:hypothetical protein ACFV42_23150 [Streptomyces solisilvae]|uniref:hypothetical protein n=1 Tax=Streptomyces malaysiensis TaxID=92644 RepID=UPI0036C005B6
MSTFYVDPRKYVVNLIPNSLGFFAQPFEISVEWRGGDARWAVVRHDQYLSSDGVWDDAPRASEREDGWLDAHRFDLDTAFRLAKEAAPHVTVKGRTAAEVLARLLATGRIAQPAAGQDETPDATVTARDLAHALDNSTPYPIKLDGDLCRFMAERLLEMLTIGKRPEHLVWQPEEQSEPGEQPEPQDPAELRRMADEAAGEDAAPPPPPACWPAWRRSGPITSPAPPCPA